ncbi:MAG: oligosaccharide flippase family protein [Solobacterium sp.]|nr:oligosaccharide flippase family protein [Solobacterium sp.]
MEINLKNRTGNTVRNTAVGMAAQMIQILSSFICRMIFVRVLTEAYLGVNGLFANILSILSLSELGISSAIKYELYHALAYEDKENAKSLMAFYKRAYVMIGLIIAGAGLLLMPFVSRLVTLDSGIKESVYLLYSLYLLNTVISYFFSYRTTIIEAAQQNYVLTLCHTAVTIFQNVSQCIVLLVTKNFVTYLLIQVFCTFLYYYLSSRKAVEMFPFLLEKEIAPIQPEQKKRLFRNTKDLFITSISGKLITQTDNIIITMLGGLVSTGLNSNYSMLLSTLISLTSKIDDAIMSSLGNVNAVESKERRLTLFYEIHFFYFWFYFWCACCFILLVQDAISLFFGAKYVMPFSVAVITGLNLYTTEEGRLLDVFKDTMGLFRYGKYVRLATGIINVLASVMLGRIWGVSGVLFATFLSLILTTRWYLPFVTFRYGFETSSLGYFKKDLLFWAEGILIFLITMFLCTRFSFGPVGNLACRMVICVIVPNLLLYLIHRNDPRFLSIRTRLEGIAAKFIKRKETS